MKSAIGWLTLALTLIVAPAATAADGRSLQLLPPPEFDHPYTGELTVVVAHSEQEVRDLCPGAKFGPAIGALACSTSLPGKCRIVLAPEEDTKALGVPAYVIWRHEIAHCNGWPADHRGALPYEEWASDHIDTLTGVASQFDNFASGVVGKTVAEVANTIAVVSEALPWSDKTKTAAAKFIIAAKSIGLGPESQITRQVLSDPAMAVLLARAAGIGRDLSDEQWRQAHADPFQASRARQAGNASGPLPLWPSASQPATRHCGLAIQKPCGDDLSDEDDLSD